MPPAMRPLNAWLAVVKGLLAEMAREIDGLEDPTERVRAASRLLQALEEDSSPLVEVRLRAIAELRETMSYDQIARLTGLSKPRVAQLSKVAAQSDER